MNIKSFNENIEFSNKVQLDLILETSFSKEIRITLSNGQNIKEHKAPYAISIHILEGKINLGVQGILNSLKRGDIISLEKNILHDIIALENTILRLTLSKNDDVKRVEAIVTN
jgi:quercetin dioxygenase-like cupin family protein